MWMMDLSRSTTKGLCARGCLRLHTFVLQGSNFCDFSRRPFVSVEEPQSFHDRLPIERALGVQWCVETDTFQLRITVQDTPLTRRIILSTVSSVYDPLGFVSPVLLVAKQILQELCKDGVEWDDPISEQIRTRWEKWRRELFLLNDVTVRRSFKPNGFQQLKSVELHHFSDVFVANRVQQIRDQTSTEQWKYVESQENPADDASRGLTAREFLNSKRWLHGPAFLWSNDLDLSTEEQQPLVDNDPEVKSNVFATHPPPPPPAHSALQSGSDLVQPGIERRLR